MEEKPYAISDFDREFMPDGILNDSIETYIRSRRIEIKSEQNFGKKLARDLMNDIKKALEKKI